MREVVKIETQVLKYLQQKENDPRQTSAYPQQIASNVPTATSKQNVHATWEAPPQARDNVLSEDTLEAIAEIERKALGEIIRLQNERDVLKE